MQIEIKCVIRDDEGNVLQEFTVVEFQSASVINVGEVSDAGQN